MSSSITTPNLVIASEKAIMEAQRGIALASLFSTDFSAEMKGIGATIAVPVFSGDATEFKDANDNTNNDFETTDGAIISVNVPLEHLVKVTYQIGMKDLTEIDRAGTFRNAGVAGGRAISRKIENLIVGKLTYSDAKAQETSFSIERLGKAIATAEKNDLDPATLVAVLNPDTYGDLLDANTANAAIMGADIAGALGRRYGIKAIVCSACVANASSSSATKGVGFLVSDAAIAVGARGIEEAVPGTFAEYGVASDEASGLPVTTFVHGTGRKNSGFLNVACQLGVKLTRTSTNKAPGYIQLVTA